MKILLKIYRNFVPKYLEDKTLPQESVFRYKRVWTYVVLITSAVALTPLIFMTFININQYQKTFKNEMMNPILALTSNAKHSLEFNFEERKAALTYIISDKSFKELSDGTKLANCFHNLKQSFGGFVDLGLIDSKGIQISYIGPYELQGKNYIDQNWFNEVRVRDFCISDVFMGFRGSPHFVIAVKREKDKGAFYILRATIDIEFINRQIGGLHLRPSSDAFLINRQGILQTSSYFFGDILEKYTFGVPRYSSYEKVIEIKDDKGYPYILGYSYIEQSPFIFMAVESPEDLMKNWFSLRSSLLVFLLVSVIVIILVIFWSSTYMVNKIKEADIKRARVVHDLEYTNKMASIGRLAAGVAHEINNPMAIINQKAGLLKDIVSAQNDNPYKDKFLGLADSILQSVDRCGAITHRFLGFAKRMDFETTPINLELLIKEVLEFLGNEASYRNISINLHAVGSLPEIESDRGHLQQVFLNIINNAYAATSDGGNIDIIIKEKSGYVKVIISDNGGGIPEEHLEHIFEPFYTTKKEGTGLGLSITYNIVHKLGGDIKVKSKVGKGTSFTVSLPIKN